MSLALAAVIVAALFVVKSVVFDLLDRRERKLKCRHESVEALTARIDEVERGARSAITGVTALRTEVNELRSVLAFKGRA